MTISFNEIPINLRTPGVYAEMDNTQAVRGLPGMPYTALLIGQRLSTGTVAAEVPTSVTNADQAKQYFGDNSMLHHMAQKWFDNNAWTKMFVIAVDDNGAGAAATSTITLTGSASETGTLNIYIGGRRVQVGVSSGDANTAVAAAIDAKINAASNLAVTSSVTSGVVTLTARHKGEVGNDIDVRLNYYV
ncbi:MAG: phage tail protein, partial [Gammaproteobacteria bacterium]